MDARVQLLLEVFDQAYTAPSWHGTPLRGTLRGLSARQALWRPGATRHCIWDLVLHTAYWKCMVRRLGSNWLALPDRRNDAAWKRDRALLDEQHRLLHNAIAKLKPADLGRRGWRSQWPVKAEIYGIASHDLYHAGQIQMLKRLMRK